MHELWRAIYPVATDFRVENVASFPLIHTDLKIEFASETQCIVAINTSSVAYNMASVEINMASVA
jgi:hypothetical protein